MFMLVLIGKQIRAAVFVAGTCTLIVATFMTPWTGVAVAQESFPVEPLSLENVAKPNFEAITSNVQNLANVALLFQNAADELDASWDGSPEQAARIVLVKLQIMEKIAAAIPLTVFATEEFKARGTIFYQQIVQQRESVGEQLATLQVEIDRLAATVKDQSIDSAEPGLVVLLAKNLERRADLEKDVKSCEEFEAKLRDSAAVTARLEKSLQLFREMAIVETRRQQDAGIRTRLARQSTLLRDEAEKLVAAVNALDPAISRFPTQSNPPVMLDQPPAAEPIPLTVPPAARELVEKYFESTKKADK